MDVDAIQPGADFTDAINQAVGACDVLVSIIGKQWLSLSDARGRPRLDDRRDLVRLEIQSALERKIRVVPTLVQGAQMPRADQLPRSLAKLAGRNAIEISHVRWQQDLGRLIATLENPTPRSEPRVQNLPRQLTSFVGRTGDVAAIKQTLLSVRLLTLTGPGGCGKTRLALHAAAELLDEYPDGVWLVEFAPATDPELVPHIVASTLRVHEQPGQPLTETLISYLQGQRALLILDNCEHLVNACASLADALLRACPELHVLATSREVLNVVGEVSRQVPSLGLPGPMNTVNLDAIARSEAVQLFIDRARLVRSDFALSETNASAVAQVCQRLDGIPLAIELAAARVRMLPPSEILDRLHDRFRLLTSGSRTALPRQQTLRAAVEWSYKLLSQSEQILFNRLSVFAAAFSLESAETVCAGDDVAHEQILEVLGALVDKSLVVVGEASDGRSRYVLLESLRQYGREQLQQLDSRATRMRHASYYFDLGRQAEPHLFASFEVDSWSYWLARLNLELADLRSALTWAFANDAASAAELVIRLGWFWWFHGYVVEGREWLAKAMAIDLTDPAMRATALAADGRLASRAGAHREAANRFREAASISRRIDDKSRLAFALFDLGTVARATGKLGRALLLLDKSQSMWRLLGDTRMVGYAQQELGVLAMARGDDELAEKQFTIAIDTFRTEGDRWGLGLNLANLAELRIRRGDTRSAVTMVRESLSVTDEFGDPFVQAQLLDYAGIVAIGNSAVVDGVRLVAAATMARRRLGAVPSLAHRTLVNDWRRKADLLIGSQAARKAWDAGSTIDTVEALEAAHVVTTNLSGGPAI